MSNEALTWAFEQTIKPSGRHFVLVALANYADSQGWCYPSQETLAKRTSQDERTVRDHLKALEEEGLIAREPRRRKDGKRTSDGFTLVGFIAVEGAVEEAEATPAGGRAVNRKISPVEPADRRKKSTPSPEKSPGDQPERFSGNPSVVYPSETQTEGRVAPPAADSGGAPSPEDAPAEENPTAWARRVWRDGQGWLHDCLSGDAERLGARQTRARVLWNQARQGLVEALGEERVDEIEQRVEPWEAFEREGQRSVLRLRTALAVTAFAEPGPGSWQALLEAATGHDLMPRPAERCVTPEAILEAAGLCGEVFVVRWQRPFGRAGREGALSEGTVVLAARDEATARLVEACAGEAIAGLFGCAVRFEAQAFVSEAAERYSAGGGERREEA